MLPLNLTTNEIRDAAAVEIEFSRMSQNDNSVTFVNTAASPAYPHTIKVSHQSLGGEGTRRRRSLIRVDYSHAGLVSGKVYQTLAYTVLDRSLEVSNNDAAKMALANLGSLLSTLGTNLHLYDGTGNGAAALLNGTL